MAFSQNPPCGQCAELSVAESAGLEKACVGRNGEEPFYKSSSP